MKKIEINCEAITDRASFHTVLAEALSLPQWYGRNLDALHDCLTDFCEVTYVCLTNWEMAEAALGSYGKAARRVMEQADLDNPNIHIECI